MTPASTTLLDHLRSWPLALLPHQLLSRVMRRATRWRVRWWKNFLIDAFIRWFGVDMSQARSPSTDDYPDFNSFFTRALQKGMRPLPDVPDAIACPVDGTVSACGPIDQDRILQAKGHDYSLTTLLGSDTQCAARFQNGHFVTLYLSPRDYHRVHMPCAGRLTETTYVPGRLFSVAPHTTRAIRGLFTRNERLACLFDTDDGPLAMIMVGAVFVSCMETVWGGVVNPRMHLSLQTRKFDETGGTPPVLQRGDEMGRFNIGSTVILLFGPGQAEWSAALQPGKAVALGQAIGTLQH